MKRLQGHTQAKVRAAAGRAKQPQVKPAVPSFDPTEKAILHSLGWAIFLGLTFLAIGWNWTEISGWLYHTVGHAPTAVHSATRVLVQIASR